MRLPLEWGNLPASLPAALGDLLSGRSGRGEKEGGGDVEVGGAAENFFPGTSAYWKLWRTFSRGTVRHRDDVTGDISPNFGRSFVAPAAERIHNALNAIAAGPM